MENRPGRKNKIRPNEKHLVLVFTNILLLLFVCGSAQNTLDLAGLTASSPASVAYSVRKLSSAYSGPLIRVRRSSDNATLDIGFTGSGHLDTNALKTFVGGSNGLIATWYDQSGNNSHLTQATNGNQPIIVAGGVVQRENNRPFIRFWGVVSTSHNSLNLPFNMTTVGHVASVIRFVPGGYGFILSSGGAYNWHGASPGSAFLIHPSFASTSVRTGLAWQDGNPVSPTSFPWPISLTLAEFAPASPSVNTAWNNIGNDRNCCHFLSGGSGYSELIIFGAQLAAAERQAMANNQRTFFSIGVTLPVTWKNFSVKEVNKQIEITWETLTEENTKEFVVQRSNKDFAWSDIAIVKAAGYSQQSRQYKTIDPSILQEKHYYRILQKDADGRVNYSDVKSIQPTPGRPGISVLNTVAVNGVVRIQLQEVTQLSLFNATGQLIWEKKLNAGIHSVGIGHFQKGIYFLKANEKVEKIRLQ